MKTDEQIKQDIVNRLAWDSRVNASEVTVEVDNGKVVLGGNTPTYSQKVNAASVTWNVAGVTSVTNDIKVQFPLAFTTPTDDQIKNSVDSLLSWNADLEEENITVKVDNGFVTLEGSVPTMSQKIQAETEASSVSGVIDVTNKLAVVPSEEIGDELLGERIMDKVEQNAPLFVDNVDVKVNHGMVTLSGSVPTWDVWRSVYNSTRNTMGVTDVNDKLAITYSA